MWGWVKKVKSRDIKELNQFVYISLILTLFFTQYHRIWSLSGFGSSFKFNIPPSNQSSALFRKKCRSLKTRCVLLLIIENLRPNKPLNKHFMNDQNTKGGFICTFSLLSSLSFTFQSSKFNHSSSSKWQLKWLSKFRCQFRCQFTVPQKR